MPRTAKYMNERIRAVLQRNNVPVKLYLCRRYHGWDENRAATTPADNSRYNPIKKYKIHWYDGRTHSKNVSGTQQVADFLTHKLKRTITKNMIVSRFYAKRRPVHVENFFIERV